MKVKQKIPDAAENVAAVVDDQYSVNQAERTMFARQPRILIAFIQELMLFVERERAV